MIFYYCHWSVDVACFFSGSKILPDFFLDEAIGTSMNDQPQAPPTSNNTPASVFTSIKPLLNADIVNTVQASYMFVLSGGNQGNWLLDMKTGDGSVGEVAEGTTADVTFKMDSQDMVDMFQGKLSSTSAFMSGKMKISGDFSKAMKLEKLMNQVTKSKL